MPSFNAFGGPLSYLPHFWSRSWRFLGEGCFHAGSRDFKPGLSDLQASAGPRVIACFIVAFSFYVGSLRTEAGTNIFAHLGPGTGSINTFSNNKPKAEGIVTDACLMSCPLYLCTRSPSTPKALTVLSIVPKV